MAYLAVEGSQCGGERRTEPVHGGPAPGSVARLRSARRVVVVLVPGDLAGGDVVHGTDDRVIPFWHGRELYEKAREPKMHVWIDGGGHNDVLFTGGRELREAFQALVEKAGRTSEDS